MKTRSYSKASMDHVSAITQRKIDHGSWASSQVLSLTDKLISTTLQMGLLTRFWNPLLRRLNFPSKMTIIHQLFHIWSSGNLAESMQRMNLFRNGPVQRLVSSGPAARLHGSVFGDTEAWVWWTAFGTKGGITGDLHLESRLKDPVVTSTRVKYDLEW